MHRDTFGRLAVAAFGLVLVSFVVLGLTRGFVGYRTARLLAAPTALAAAVLVAYLFVTSVLAVAGLRPLDDE